MQKQLTGIVTLLVLIFWNSNLAAHPGVGIVRDSRGNIFYTDLTHVWQLSPDGKKSIAVKNVHTHELYLDKQDNLFGEDSRYEGEATNRYHYRIWKLSPDGKLSDAVKEKPGFRDDRGLVRDEKGNEYWISYPPDPPGRTLIRKRDKTGQLTTLTPGQALGRLSGLAVSAEGNAIFATSGTGLYRLTPAGRVTPLLHTTNQQNQALMGIWPEKDGSVYVAAYGEKAIKKVAKSGAVTTVARSSGNWAPSGLCLALGKTLWILEYSTSNQARVRKKEANGKERIF